MGTGTHAVHVLLRAVADDTGHAVGHYDYVQTDHADIRPIDRRSADALASSKRQALAEAVPEAAGAGAPSPGGASDRSSLVVDPEAS